MLTNREFLDLVDQEASDLEVTISKCPECYAAVRGQCTWCRPLKQLAEGIRGIVSLIRKKGRSGEVPEF